MTTAPLRSAAVEFALTVYEISPLPWPSVGASEIHATSDRAVHVHSRLTETASRPLPPAFSIIDAAPLTANAQRVSVGFATFVVEAPPHATAIVKQSAIALRRASVERRATIRA
jgi:hypothetical protein